MPVIGLNHFNICGQKAEIEILKKFYSEIIGLKVGLRPPFKSYGYWLYSGDHDILHLTERSEPKISIPNSYLDHIALTCTGFPDFEARLRKFQISHEVERVPLTNQVQVFLEDPVGNALELNFQEKEARIILVPYSERDFSLLDRSNTEAQRKYLGGPESADKLQARHRKYVDQASPGKFQMFIIEKDSESVGYTGYWERTWNGVPIYETGWGIFDEYQGNGIATAAVSTLVETLTPIGEHSEVHAFPGISNNASNAVCKKVGFQFLGPSEIEYPPGNWLKCNDWCFRIRE